MKLLAYLLLIVGSLTGLAYAKNPEEFQNLLESFQPWLTRMQSSLEANPVPLALALGTFVITFVYHKAKGKSFRESVEVAATRVSVVTPPSTPPREPENPVLIRAQARSTRTQLIADQIGIQNRIRHLPNAIIQAEKDACFSMKAVMEAKRVLGEKHKTNNIADKKLAELRAELQTGEQELVAIEQELQKLQALV